MKKYLASTALLSLCGHAAAALPPCLTRTTYGVTNPGFSASDPRIDGSDATGFYEKVAPTPITICTGTSGQCGDSTKVSAFLQSYSVAATVSTAAAGYSPVGSQADFARIDACKGLSEGTTLAASKNGSPTDPLNPVGQKVPTLDINGEYTPNSGGEIITTIPTLPSPLNGLNAPTWAKSGAQVKYHTIVPAGFTGVGPAYSHDKAWAFITAIDGGVIDAAFAGFLGTSYAYMSAVVTYGNDAAMAAAITSGSGKFGSFYGTDLATKTVAGRTVLSFQCPDDMTQVNKDSLKLASQGYTERTYFLPPVELTIAANNVEAAMAAASDAGSKPPQTSSIPVLREYLQSISPGADIRAIDIAIARRFGLGAWGTLLAATQVTVPAAVTSGSPKAFDYFLNPASPKPVAMPYIWGRAFSTSMTYTPLKNNSTQKLDGHYWDIQPSPLCRPRHKSYDFYDPYAGRSIN